MNRNKKTTAKCIYMKLALQWLNKALCNVASIVVADSLCLRKRRLLVGANHYRNDYP